MHLNAAPSPGFNFEPAQTRTVFMESNEANGRNRRPSLKIQPSTIHTMIKHKTIEVNGLTSSIARLEIPNPPAILLLHGFPNLVAHVPDLIPQLAAKATSSRRPAGLRVFPTPAPRQIQYPSTTSRRSIDAFT